MASKDKKMQLEIRKHNTKLDRNSKSENPTTKPNTQEQI